MALGQQSSARGLHAVPLGWQMHVLRLGFIAVRGLCAGEGVQEWRWGGVAEAEGQGGGPSKGPGGCL